MKPIDWNSDPIDFTQEICANMKEQELLCNHSHLRLFPAERMR